MTKYKRNDFKIATDDFSITIRQTNRKNKENNPNIILKQRYHSNYIDEYNYTLNHYAQSIGVDMYQASMYINDHGKEFNWIVDIINIQHQEYLSMKCKLCNNILFKFGYCIIHFPQQKQNILYQQIDFIKKLFYLNPVQRFLSLFVIMEQINKFKQIYPPIKDKMHIIYQNTRLDYITFMLNNIKQYNWQTNNITEKSESTFCITDTITQKEYNNAFAIQELAFEYCNYATIFFDFVKELSYDFNRITSFFNSKFHVTSKFNEYIHIILHKFQQTHPQLTLIIPEFKIFCEINFINATSISYDFYGEIIIDNFIKSFFIEYDGLLHTQKIFNSMTDDKFNNSQERDIIKDYVVWSKDFSLLRLNTLHPDILEYEVTTFLNQLIHSSKHIIYISNIEHRDNIIQTMEEKYNCPFNV